MCVCVCVCVCVCKGSRNRNSRVLGTQVFVVRWGKWKVAEGLTSIGVTVVSGDSFGLVQRSRALGVDR